MFNALSIDTWTIFTTLITGALFGFFILFGAVALIIRREMQVVRSRKAGNSELPAGLTVVRTQDQVYDFTKNRHLV